MQKEYDKWNEIKKVTSVRDKFPLIKIGDVYWCRVGLNIGNEFDGKNENFVRPVLVIKKFTRTLAFVIPLTTKMHKGDWYFDIEIENRKVQAILNQGKPIDIRRFENFIVNLSENKIRDLIESFKRLF